MSTSDYVTEEELAGSLGLTLRNVRDLRNRHQWPHLRFGRFGVRYTDGQVAAIEDLMTVRRASAKKSSGLPGQTEGSRKRSA